jgi:hypothetical protein
MEMNMASDAALEVSSLLAAQARLPQHVVYRSFPSETVVLNLQSGTYHGLNATAGRMLEALESAATVADAVSELASSYGQPQRVIELDVCELCKALLERGLIDVDGHSRA